MHIDRHARQFHPRHRATHYSQRGQAPPRRGPEEAGLCLVRAGTFWVNGDKMINVASPFGGSRPLGLRSVLRARGADGLTLRRKSVWVETAEKPGVGLRVCWSVAGSLRHGRSRLQHWLSGRNQLFQPDAPVPDRARRSMASPWNLKARPGHAPRGLLVALSGKGRRAAQGSNSGTGAGGSDEPPHSSELGSLGSSQVHPRPGSRGNRTVLSRFGMSEQKVEPL